jgi:hypothetical protein
MTSAGFKPAIPATKRPQTYALDRAATGIGSSYISNVKNKSVLLSQTWRCYDINMKTIWSYNYRYPTQPERTRPQGNHSLHIFWSGNGTKDFTDLSKSQFLFLFYLAAFNKDLNCKYRHYWEETPCKRSEMLKELLVHICGLIELISTSPERDDVWRRPYINIT